MNLGKTVWRAASIIALCFIAGCATAPKVSDQPEFLEESRATTHYFQNAIPDISKQIDNSGGFVVFPGSARWGIMISGGAFGRGVVCRPDGTPVGWAAVNNASLGLQAGVEGYRMLIVLQDKDALDKLESNKLTGSVAATIVAADTGAGAVAPFQDGVAVYVGKTRGLMAGMNVGLNYIRYQPRKPDDMKSFVR